MEKAMIGFAKAAKVQMGPPPDPNREEHPYQASANFQGILIYVENKAGTTRSGASGGHKWKIRMRYDYGEIPGTRGADGDPIDVYLGPNPASPTAYVLHQKHNSPDPEAPQGTYDEDKVMLGFDSIEGALRAYMSHFDGPMPWPGVTVLPVAVLKQRVHCGDLDLGTALVKADKPPGSGWEAIPGGKHQGYRRKTPGPRKYEYWYPDQKPVSSAKKWEEDYSRSFNDIKPGEVVMLGGKHGYWRYTPEHFAAEGDAPAGTAWFTSTASGEHLFARTNTVQPIKAEAKPKKPKLKLPPIPPPPTKEGHVRIGDWEGPIADGPKPETPKQGEELGGKRRAKPYPDSEHPAGSPMHQMETGEWILPGGKTAPVMLHQVKTGDDRMRWAVWVPAQLRNEIVKQADRDVKRVTNKVMRMVQLPRTTGGGQPSTHYDAVKSGALLGLAMAFTRYQGGKPFMAVASRYMGLYAMREARHLKTAATIPDRVLRNINGYIAAKYQTQRDVRAEPSKEEIAERWRISKKHAYAGVLGKYTDEQGVVSDQGEEQLPAGEWRVRGPDGREHGDPRPGKLALMDAYDRIMAGDAVEGIDWEGEGKLDVLPNQAELGMPLGAAFHLRLEIEGGLEQLTPEQRTALSMHAGLHSGDEPADLLTIADALDIKGSTATKRRRVNEILNSAVSAMKTALDGTEAKRHVKRLFGGRRHAGEDPAAEGPSPFRPSQTALADRFGSEHAAAIYNAALRGGNVKRTVALLEKQKLGSITPAEIDELETAYAAQVDRDRLEAFRRYRAQPVDPQDTRPWGPQGDSPYGSVETDYLITKIKG
jgi:hypothetical protein